MKSQAVPEVSYFFKRDHLFSVELQRVARGPLGLSFSVTVAMLSNESGQIEHLRAILGHFLTNYYIS